MINYRIFLKSIKVMMLPTVVVLFVAFFVTLDIRNFMNLVMGGTTSSYFFRIILLIVEIVSVVYLYKYYLKQEKINSITEINNSKFDNLKKIRSYTGMNTHFREHLIRAMFPTFDSAVYKVELFQHKDNEQLYIVQIQENKD